MRNYEESIPSHGDLVENAAEAIDIVFGDTSVSKKQIKESLNELVDMIKIMLDTLE